MLEASKPSSRHTALSLDAFFKEHIFKPLDMTDTHFYLEAKDAPRLAAQYRPGKDKKIELQDPGSLESRWINGPQTLYWPRPLRMGGLLTHALGLDHLQTRPPAGCTHRSY